MTTAVPGTPPGDRARADPPQHEAVRSSDADELAGLLAPRIRTALAAHHVVVAVVDDAHEAALRAVLGDRAGGVEFHDPAAVHSVPAFTVAVRFSRESRRAERAGGHALVIVQHLPDLRTDDHGYWARLDIALNVAIAGLPVTVLCPCSDADLAQLATTHPVITNDAGSTTSPRYRQPHDAVIDYPPPPPPDLGPPTAQMTFDVAELGRLRHLVGDVAGRGGLVSDLVADLVLAVNELASNSVEHGSGSGELRIWSDPSGPVVVEIIDHGGEIDAPFPGLAFPPPEGARGRGLWLASELCDVLQVWSDAEQTVVRVQISG